MLKKKLSESAATCSDAKKSKCSDDALNLSVENCAPLDKSRFFPNLAPTGNFQQQFLDIQLDLNRQLKTLTFKPPVAYIYNPVEYAFKANETYVNKYCTGTKKLLFVGMNPGPFGMCQTGVPFGEVKLVRDWLKIEEDVGKPDKECPKRPILGFACTRTEISGDRFWTLLKNLCTTADNFFKNAFVYNYCPLALMKSDGCNLTPRDIKDHKELEDICDKSYARIISLLQPEIVIGIGEYTEKRTLTVLKDEQIADIKVLRLPHPSPRSLNNQNWPDKGELFFRENDLLKYFDI